MEFLKTPYDVCLKYIQFEDTIKSLVNKKRKEAEREMKSIQDQYRSLINDIKSVREISSIGVSLTEEQNGLLYTETYIKQQTDKICEILIDKGFIKHFNDIVEQGNQSFIQTELGSIASSIAEIHPLIISEFMVSNNYFVEFSTKQLVGLFSCFTDVKIPSDQRTTIPNSEDPFLNQKIKLIQQMC